MPPSTDHEADPRPRVAITMGDPAGVGPEVIAAAWAEDVVHGFARPVVWGDAAVMQRALDLRGVRARAEPMATADAFSQASPNLMPCVEGPTPCPAFTPGVVDGASGRAAYQAILGATKLALDGGCDGVVTAPISKAALHAAGLPYPGHTELLAELCGVRDFAMMLYLPQRLAPRTRAGLGVVHVTLHASVREAIDRITTEGVLAKCHLAHRAAEAYGAASPRIGVAALNPHAGEGGLFGDEEARLIAPAVALARSAGLDASGPHPADTLMHRAAAGEFDVVVAMLHDQGHIALKLLGMHGAVNVTLGLPIVRTSVAHGTASDLAWKGVAETSGMVAAIECAASLSKLRNRQDATSAKDATQR
ncbi:MAG: 4-hydroxythreonine-4-phosphate dehydrogenase PdxA [Lacipirellulaceae bacterium]